MSLRTSVADKGRPHHWEIVSADSAESRSEFEKLNGKTPARAARMRGTPGQVGLMEGGADSDVVDIPQAGPSNLKVVDGGGRRMYAAKVQVVFWGEEWISTPPPNPSIEVDVLVWPLIESPSFAARMPTCRFRPPAGNFEGGALVSDQVVAPFAIDGRIPKGSDQLAHVATDAGCDARERVEALTQLLGDFRHDARDFS